PLLLHGVSTALRFSSSRHSPGTFFLFFLLLRRPPCSTLFPYTTLWSGVRSECHLQVRAPLLLERDLIWVTRLRHEGHGRGPRGHGKENGQKDHRRLQPAPAQVGQRLDENGSHRDASSLRTRITSEAARSGLSRRASSTIFPSMTLITRAA